MKVIFLPTINVQSYIDAVVFFLLRNVCCVLARNLCHALLPVTPGKQI